MGSDTGGSIRIPAAYCGCVGLKPTFGRVSRFGTMPLGGSLDHMGPMTATSRDAALVLNAIAGYDPRDESSSSEPVVDFTNTGSSPKNLRIGIAENFFSERVIPEIAAAFDEALKRAEKAGGRIVRVRVPDPAHINAIGRVILLAEVSALMDPYKDRRADIGPDVQALLDQGRLILATDYVNAQRLRRKYQREWSKLWGGIDVLFTPTAPIFAPLIGQTEISWGEKDDATEDVRLATTRLVRGINVLGLPALSIPLHNKGLPAGLQIIAPPMREDIALTAGTLLE
jgi:aspartyl-tRNA(Asn)/glutamyl-tRNA(Gln) amidotransferase subunit A